MIAYLDAEPVGWIAVEPRPNYPIALRGKVVVGGSIEPSDHASVWAVVCFVVRVGYRSRGIGASLIAGRALVSLRLQGRVLQHSAECRSV
jgi:GNAT superfamily N-acetyltransferase